MKSRTLATVSVAAIAALTLPLVAHAERGHHRGGPGGMMNLEKVDTNGDGNITAEEATAARAAMFAEIDANGDGNVTPEEMTAHHEAKRAERRAKMQSKMFSNADTNGDGVISADEFNLRPMRGFSAADADGDGVITAEEREAMRAKWKEGRGKKWRDRAAPADDAE